MPSTNSNSLLTSDNGEPAHYLLALYKILELKHWGGG